MRHKATASMALLAAGIAFGAPLGAPAQTYSSGNQQAAMLQNAMRNADRELRMLSTLPNQISVTDISLVSVDGMSLSAAQRQSMSRAYGASRRAALQAALSKATVADTDRRNGSSEDQSSLAEYLQHNNIDPSRVVAVDVNARQDPQNPRVTVFYRGRLRNTTQGG